MTAFQAANIQSIARVAEIATEVEYAAGETIEAEGARRRTASSSSSTDTWRSPMATPPSSDAWALGIWSAVRLRLGVKKRLFAAKAITPAVLLCIRYDDLMDIMEDHFDLTFSALFALGNDIERTFTSPRVGQVPTGRPSFRSETAPPA